MACRGREVPTLVTLLVDGAVPLGFESRQMSCWGAEGISPLVSVLRCLHTIKLARTRLWW